MGEPLSIARTTQATPSAQGWTAVPPVDGAAARVVAEAGSGVFVCMTRATLEVLGLFAPPRTAVPRTVEQALRHLITEPLIG